MEQSSGLEDGREVLAWQPPWLLLSLTVLWLALFLSLGPLCPRSACSLPLGSAVRMRF